MSQPYPLVLCARVTDRQTNPTGSEVFSRKQREKLRDGFRIFELKAGLSDIQLLNQVLETWDFRYDSSGNNLPDAMALELGFIEEDTAPGLAAGTK